MLSIYVYPISLVDQERVPFFLDVLEIDKGSLGSSITSARFLNRSEGIGEII